MTYADPDKEKQAKEVIASMDILNPRGFQYHEVFKELQSKVDDLTRMSSSVNDVPGYESLRTVLEEAYDQAARGKGKERHALDLPFHEQRMQSISHLLNSERGMAYQACKKIAEGLDLPTYEAKRRELLGAINYIAGILIYLDSSENGESDD